MKNKYKLTLDALKEKVLEGKYISIEELEEYLKSKGLPLKVAPGYTVKHYIEDLRDQNVVKEKVVYIYKITKHGKSLL